jgi:hypothetical protein
MTPRAFLRRLSTKKYADDPCLVNGQFFSRSALSVAPGDTVGVVLLSLGGPDGEEADEMFALLNDPDAFRVEHFGDGRLKPNVQR